MGPRSDASTDAETYLPDNQRGNRLEGARNITYGSHVVPIEQTHQHLNHHQKTVKFDETKLCLSRHGCASSVV